MEREVVEDGLVVLQYIQEEGRVVCERERVYPVRSTAQDCRGPSGGPTSPQDRGYPTLAQSLSALRGITGNGTNPIWAIRCYHERQDNVMPG